MANRIINIALLMAHQLRRIASTTVKVFKTGHLPETIVYSGPRNVEASAPLLNMGLFIERMVCVSAGHLQHATAKALGLDQGKSGEPLLWNTISYVYFHEYGWIIHCSEDAVAAVKDEHLELATLIGECLKYGAHYLRLDTDGPKLSDMPSFTW